MRNEEIFQPEREALYEWIERCGIQEGDKVKVLVQPAPEQTTIHPSWLRHLIPGSVWTFHGSTQANGAVGLRSIRGIWGQPRFTYAPYWCLVKVEEEEHNG